MVKLSKAELKKVILAAEAKRSKYPVAFRPDPAQYPKLRSGRRAAEKLVSEFLRKAGLDTKKLEALQKQQSTEMRRIIDKHKADALKLATRQNDTLHSTILQQSKALRHLADQGDGFFPSTTFLLDTPNLIWTIPVNLALSHSAVVPGGSWAKFRLRSSESRVQKVSFYFFWTNPYSDFAVIDAITFLSATGFVTANANYSFWSPSQSDVIVQGRFAIWFQLPQEAASTPFTRAFLGRTGALSPGGVSWPFGDSESTSISAGANMTQTRFAIPPQQFVIFEVALALDYQNLGDADIDADFESGDFKVVCPVVAFWLVNQPPVNV